MFQSFLGRRPRPTSHMETSGGRVAWLTLDTSGGQGTPFRAAPSGTLGPAGRSQRMAGRAASHNPHHRLRRKSGPVIVSVRLQNQSRSPKSPAPTPSLPQVSIHAVVTPIAGERFDTAPAARAGSAGLMR